MNKLQLYITLSQDDFKSMVEINPDSYVQSWVSDLRPILNQIAYDASSKAIFYMLKYIDSGFFITIIRTIPKQPMHHLAAWIFVPYALRVSNHDLYDVVQFITQKVSNSEVRPKDIDEMNKLFGHAYEEDLQAPSFPASQGLNVAYRYYGPRVDVTLADLLGVFRFQTAYLPFAGVLLVDHDLSNDVSGTNLTSAPLENMAVLFPPERPNEEGYTPYLYNEAFDMAYYVPMGRNIDIIWRKPDAADLKQTIYVAQSEMRAPNLNLQRHNPASQPQMQPSQSEIPQPVSQPAMPVNPVVDEGGDLPHRKKTYRFQIPAKSAAIGTVIEFEITTSNDLDGSPIDGYEPTAEVQEGAGRSNHLLYKADNRRKKLLNNLLYAVIGFVIGVLVMLVCTGTHEPKRPAPAAQPNSIDQPAEEVVVNEEIAPVDQSQQTPAKAEAPAAATAPAVQDRSLEAAILYLDGNQTWTREEMEQYPDLKGLYNDMNNIERKKLVEVWGPKLKNSRAFTNQIVHHSRLSYKKKARRTPFNSSSEKQEIRIQSYLNNIDP